MHHETCQSGRDHFVPSGVFGGRNSGTSTCYLEDFNTTAA